MPTFYLLGKFIQSRLKSKPQKLRISMAEINCKIVVSCLLKSTSKSVNFLELILLVVNLEFVLTHL